MTNREWLEMLTDEELAEWCSYDESLDYISSESGMQMISRKQPTPKLITIKYSSFSNDKKENVLDWLKSERREKTK